jgi:hypothetical protein
MRFDYTAPLATQLQWFSEAGFVDADCAFKDGMFAVVRAINPNLRLNSSNS